jgi:arginine-tRNA-protein transferase
VRVLAAEFEATASQRKLLRRHADLEVSACKPWTTDEQYQLLRRYLSVRHPGGGMAEMDESDFADMVEQTPVRTYVIEYREPSIDGRPGQAGGGLPQRPAERRPVDDLQLLRRRPGRAQGLGTFIILDHIVRAARAALPYVYLGYWVEGSSRMAYKTSFRPLERLGRDGWRRTDEAETDLAEDTLMLPRASRPAPFTDRRLTWQAAIVAGQFRSQQRPMPQRYQLRALRSPFG